MNITSSGGHEGVVYDMVDLPAMEMKNEAAYKVVRGLKDVAQNLAEARREFVYMSEEDRRKFADYLLNALLRNV